MKENPKCEIMINYNKNVEKLSEIQKTKLKKVKTCEIMKQRLKNYCKIKKIEAKYAKLK